MTADRTSSGSYDERWFEPIAEPATRQSIVDALRKAYQDPPAKLPEDLQHLLARLS